MTTAQPAVPRRATGRTDQARQPFVYRNMILLFAVVVACFTAWGIESTLLGVIGGNEWKQLTSDQLRWDGPRSDRP
jgi:hypothetical protein